MWWCGWGWGSTEQVAFCPDSSSLKRKDGRQRSDHFPENVTLSAAMGLDLRQVRPESLRYLSAGWPTFNCLFDYWVLSCPSLPVDHYNMAIYWYFFIFYITCLPILQKTIYHKVAEVFIWLNSILCLLTLPKIKVHSGLYASLLFLAQIWFHFYLLSVLRM